MQVHRRRSNHMRLPPARPRASVHCPTSWQGCCPYNVHRTQRLYAAACRTHANVCSSSVSVVRACHSQVDLQKTENPILGLLFEFKYVTS
jgi:hypothetical protein